MIIENGNPEISLLEGQSEGNPQAPSDGSGSLLSPETKETNAFQTMQKTINSQKAELEKVTKEFEAFKAQQLTSSGKIETPVSNDNNMVAEMTKILSTFKADFEGKLDNISKSFQQQQQEQQIGQDLISVNKALGTFTEMYGLEKWQTENFVKHLDVTGTGFENNMEGKMKYLLQYANTPGLIITKLEQVSPKDIQTALKNKQTINAKTVNKQQTATPPRVGEFNPNLTNEKTAAENRVKEFLEKETQKVELKITGKAY